MTFTYISEETAQPVTIICRFCETFDHVEVPAVAVAGRWEGEDNDIDPEWVAVCTKHRDGWFGGWLRWLNAQFPEGSFWRGTYGIALALLRAGPLLLALLGTLALVVLASLQPDPDGGTTADLLRVARAAGLVLPQAVVGLPDQAQLTVGHPVVVRVDEGRVGADDLLELPDAMVVERLSSRRLCSGCGRGYHIIQGTITSN